MTAETRSIVRSRSSRRCGLSDAYHNRIRVMGRYFVPSVRHWSDLSFPSEDSPPIWEGTDVIHEGFTMLARSDHSASFSACVKSSTPGAGSGSCTLSAWAALCVQSEY